MKLWNRDRTDGDPWNSPEQRKAADPWDNPEHRKAADPWEGAGWMDTAKTREETEQEAAITAKREDDSPAILEQGREASSGTAQGDGESAGYGMRIAGAVMTIVSYALLFRLPDTMTYTAYGAFFLSVLLFCIGFFWVTADFPEPATRAGMVLLNGGICAAAAAFTAAGCWYVSARDGTEGSVFVGTFLLIQSLVFLMALSDEYKEKAGPAIRAVSIGLAAWGVWLFIRFVGDDGAGEGQITAAVLLWIASIVMFQMFGTGGKKTENGGKTKNRGKTKKKRRKKADDT